MTKKHYKSILKVSYKFVFMWGINWSISQNLPYSFFFFFFLAVLTVSTRWQFCIERYVDWSIHLFCSRFLCNRSIWQCGLLNRELKLQSHCFIGWLELQHSGRNWGFLWSEQSVREPWEHDHHLLHKGLLVWQTGRWESGGKFQAFVFEYSCIF